MKILFIGTVESSLIFLKTLVSRKADIIGVITKSHSKFNADFVDITPICIQNKIPFLITDDINHDQSLEWIQSKNSDIIFCFGWSSLLKEKLLKIPPMGILGYHPAELPFNRGRHPIIWALALDLSQTASTFFFMDKGADSGDILSQEIVPIDYQDTARTLYDKLLQTAQRQITHFLPLLINKTFTKKPQDHKLANYWRKRNDKDGKIDFRMSSQAIYNLVRALTHPYVGANIVWEENKIKIWEVKEVANPIKNIECGKILAIENNQILVKCYNGAVLLTSHEFTTLPKIGDYL